MKVLFIFLSLITFSCASANEKIIDNATVVSKTLTIVQENDKCYLLHNSLRYLLAPKPPCYFLRDSGNKPQYFSYNDVGTDAVLIITGSPVSDEIRKEWGVSKDAVCGIESQGVIIKRNKIIITKNVLKGGVLCKDSGSDEKNFWYFAHGE